MDAKIFSKAWFLLLWAVLFSFSLPGVLQADDLAFPGQRSWAEPIALEGLPNLHKVNEDLYRGAQPTAAGMGHLETLGIKTVVNLRSFHSDRDELVATSLAYEHITVKAWHPQRKEVVRFLEIVTDESRRPVFVHCQHGADRTGLMCAVYRIAVCGWSKQEALEEMVEGGFGFHSIWSNIIQFVEDLDIEAIRAAAGLGENDPPACLAANGSTARQAAALAE